jgi:hypothetical protein
MVLIPQLKNTDWQFGLKKQDQTVCCLQETDLSGNDRHTLEVKGQKVVFQANRIWKHEGVAY